MNKKYMNKFFTGNSTSSKDKRMASGVLMPDVLSVFYILLTTDFKIFHP